MATSYLQRLQNARDNIAERIEEMTENPKPDYSLDGESYTWAGYMDMLVRNLELVEQAIQRATGPTQRTSFGRV